MRRTSSAMAFLLYEIYRFGRVAFALRENSPFSVK
jgi:hypothetical protein